MAGFKAAWLDHLSLCPYAFAARVYNGWRRGQWPAVWLGDRHRSKVGLDLPRIVFLFVRTGVGDWWFSPSLIRTWAILWMDR